ncbi:aromatic ring-hydroxylating oxygenase subunit alpha [Pontivivens insulae]|uniref:Salicylate 5-hydroxylase, large oxygenase component n=1 Tax=Pontivivens insulae TaxID=1639689 RepID=A0A2R8AAM7_9RHOB|nr:aromatic ring-hydroxylating dioxygenase subunit alpha [Pontivivens insulae]RED13190.1 phenylpropionate dioxygenase-like ring-hydroxylating dioxygenase large terminal subunit [Pontivivens insulae]SPF29282.1 Salicylate 5-hydroxylase, large oxygenase component [Pontivivens insulae]
MLDLASLAADLAAVRQPVAQAHGLPSALYTSEDALDLERRHIFHGGWACIGFGKDVPNPGDAKPITFLGAPLLLVRDKDGALNVFENVCRHRGMILVEEARNFGGVIRCPYHSWCYSLDGRLRATPHVGGPGINTHEAVDPATTGLTPVRTGIWMDMVFVNVSGNAAAFDDWIAPLRARWSDFEGRTIHHGGPASSFTLEVNCNWKLAIENYCESYHLPWVHPGLNSYSRLEDHYHIEHPGEFSGQGTLVYNPQLSQNKAFPDFDELPEKWDKAAEYVSLFPNVMVGIHRDHFFAILLEPVAHNRTIEHVELYYTSAEAATGEAFAALRASNAKMWKEVFVEDIFVVEGMQKGRHAPKFDGGVFSSVMDSPTHLFHDWVAARLGA